MGIRKTSGIIISYLKLLLVLGLMLCAQASAAHASRAPLKFGPEFEFQRSQISLTKVPLRRQIFSEAIRKFSKYLELDETDLAPIPEQWLKPEGSKLRYDQDIVFEGRLDFQEKPPFWPLSPTEAYIDTANVNAYTPNSWDRSPQVHISFDNQSVVKVFYTVDDVVLEAHHNPMSLDEARRYAPVLDDLIFSMSRRLPIKVPENGGGHIHIDLLQILKRADEHDPKVGLRLLRNFIVDFYSHSQFITFALRAHPTWALTLGMTSEERVLWFHETIKAVDVKIQSANLQSFDDAIDFIDKNLRPLNMLLPISLVSGDEYDNLAFPPEVGIYKPAIQFSKRLKTMEIRALNAQHSYLEFIDLAQLLNGRLDYLASLKQPLPLPEWKDIQIKPKEYYHKKLSLQTLEAVEKQAINYVSEAMMHVPKHLRPELKERLFFVFKRRLERFSCRG
jgi:hypothetical protein